MVWLYGIIAIIDFVSVGVKFEKSPTDALGFLFCGIGFGFWAIHEITKA